MPVDPYDPRSKIRQASYIADAATMAYGANKLARERVRQGVPPEQAASQAAHSMMVLAGVGTILMFQLGVMLICLLSLLSMNLGAIVGTDLLAMYGFVILYGAWTYARVAPHRKNLWQRRLSNLWLIGAMMLGWWPVLFICFGIGAVINHVLGIK